MKQVTGTCFAFLSRRVYNSNLVVFICSLVANVVFIILTVILWLNK